MITLIVNGWANYFLDWLINYSVYKNIPKKHQSQYSVSDDFFFSVLMYKDSFLQQRQQIFSVKELEQENVCLFVFVVQ